MSRTGTWHDIRASQIDHQLFKQRWGVQLLAPAMVLNSMRHCTGTQQALPRDWVHTDAAFVDSSKQMKACAVSRAPGASSIAREAAGTAQSEAGIEMYCDGAWDPEGGMFDAGAGVCEFTITTDAPSPPPPLEEGKQGPGMGPHTVYAEYDVSAF